MRTLLLSLVATSVSGWHSPFVLPARRACCVMLSDDDLSAFTVPQLKEKLRSANLPVSGRKAELIARLGLSAFTVPQLKEKLRSANLPVSGRKAELIARLGGTPAAAPPATPAAATSGSAGSSTHPVAPHLHDRVLKVKLHSAVLKFARGNDALLPPDMQQDRRDGFALGTRAGLEKAYHVRRRPG